MIYYSFGVHIRHEQGHTRIDPSIGISNKEYVMLHYLQVYSQIADVEDALLNLTQVVNGTLEVYQWGQDWCAIVSHKEISTIEHFNHEEPDWQDKPLFTTIPTTWLWTMMKDWHRFLELNRTESYLKPPFSPTSVRKPKRIRKK